MTPSQRNSMDIGKEIVMTLNRSFLNHIPPHLHLTTCKVMVIVWRLRGNIVSTVLYIANVLPLQWAQLTKTVHTAVGP